MQIKSKYTWLKHLDFMFIDLISLGVAFVLSYFMKFKRHDMFQNESWTRFILIVGLLNIVISLFTNPYSGILRRSYYQEVFKSLELTISMFLLSSLFFYLFKVGAEYSRELVLTMHGLYFLISLLLKYIWKRLLVTGKVVIYTTKRISLFIIAGRDSIEKTLDNVVAGDFQLYDIKGIHFIEKEDGVDSGKKEESIRGIPIVNAEYVQYILDNNIGEVLLAVQPSEIDRNDFQRLSDNAVGLNMVIESTIGFQTEDQYISNFGVYKALSIGIFSFTPGQLIYLGVKRCADIVFGIVGLIFLIPIAVIVKVSYLLSGDMAKVLYQQTRVGQNGKLIKMYKFRSMVPDADEVLKELLKDERYRKEWEENQKFEHDPRITKIGRILRKTSIDELPQLINVLKGEMSLVGPRPLVVGELEMQGGLKLYQKVKPGITGWWGCNGRSNISYRERLELEYYYVKNCSLYLDVLCIIRTVFAVLKKDGAQ